jgi:signal transduction histidine kinase
MTSRASPHDPRASAPDPRRGYDIHVPLALLTLLGILPMLVFALGLLQMQWWSRQQEVQREIQQATQMLALAVDTQVQASITQLERLAELPLLAPDRGTSTLEERLGRVHDYLQRMVRLQRDWESLALVDAAGRPVLDAALPLGETRPVRAASAIDEVLRTGRPVVSDVHVGNPGQRPAVVVWVPIARAGEIRWILNARLSTRYLSDLVRRPLASNEALSAILDRRGRIVARSHEFDRFHGRAVNDGSLALFVRAESGTGRLVTLEGREMVAGWQRLPTGWIVEYMVPSSQFDQPLQTTLGLAGMAGLVLLAAGLAASLWLARRLSGAVDAAVLDAARLSEAEPLPERHSPIRQMHRLFRALRGASVQLHVVSRERNTAMAQMRDALRNRDDAMHRLREALRGRDEVLEELRDAIRRRDEFLAILSHELRNPLAPIVTGCRILERSPRLADHPDRQVIEMLCRQSRQITRLVDDLLDLSRIATGKVRLQLEPCDLAKLLSDSVDAARTCAHESGQEIALEIDAQGGPLPRVTADPARIRQVFDNLLSNAAKFGREGTTVRVVVRRDDAPDDRWIEVSVVDLGRGLTVGDIARLFQPFAQIDPGIARSKGGLGLGLAMVRRLVELHGGTVTARSDGPGLGSTFTVRLPFAGPGAAAPDASATLDFMSLGGTDVRNGQR